MAIRVEKPPVALIAGPTASGKSAMALKFAEQVGGVVVNADSAQLYRDLRVLSAAPGADELSRAEHRLYGVRSGDNPCSAADWAEMAQREIADVHESGRMPILVGGTGLYLRTLLQGIAPVPPIDPDIRKTVRAASLETNRARLSELDAEATAKLNAADTTRIARALEVVLSTGRTLSQWQEEREGGIGHQIDLRPIILLPPRDWLYQRCDERFSRMVDEGAVDEVRALLEQNLDPNLPVMRAIGVLEIRAWLRGGLDRNDSIAAGQQATRRYAKRQYTWFAHQPPSDWPRFHEPLDTSMAAALALLKVTD
ncbi:tRNA (adenosine(37)-N6)-dimethylallyltransferase MiaA [Sphingomonas sp. SM33]|uniref:tRNA dimethylallyltransferase n=1 Tax=Sphingomonas telluris TaxID=2907998 RepID=A0ABS9VJW3_9SPHN|nr:tRNA (adenosine(37)-N6)-dimethylallyltransferase MiaA [Sphingomonas telluris]MCH8615283.1 tRNA (adenosine(37)-N6)-dimethylallyltransferase MiaA [Sphingomonas telluris]